MKKTKLAVMFVLIVSLCGLTAARRPHMPKDGVLLLDLGGEIPEVTSFNAFMSLFEEYTPTVLDKVRILEAAARDKDVKAVVLKIASAEYGLGKAQEFRSAIKRYQSMTDKPIHAYLELEGGGNVEYYVASACDKVYISPASQLELTGPSVFRFYLGGLWDKIYVDMEVDQIAEYKSFADMLSRRDMSEAEREVQNSILDDVYSQLVNDIADGRGVAPEEVGNWIDSAWFIPEKYIEAGALDGTRYLDEVVTELSGGKPEVLSEDWYLESITSNKNKFSKEPQVAVIYGVGPIVTGEEPGGFFSRQMIASDDMVKEMLKVMNDEDIDGVIFRVDSGGGSALASDLIWRVTQRMKKEKPIVVSMSDVAGSGGYYISCGADKIVAQPGTITGSIGILTAHLSLGRLLEKIQVGTENMGRGQYSTMGTINKKLTEAEREKVRDSISSLYELFLSRVGQGRSMTEEEVNEIGKGRVWTGHQALEIGLVDRVGGFDAAVDEMKKLLSVPAGQDVNLVYKREKVTLWKILTGRIEERAASHFLTPEERSLLEAVRFRGLWKAGTKLAVMPGPTQIR